MNNKRRFLLSIFFLLGIFSSLAAASPDIEKIKSRVVAELMKPQVDDAVVGMSIQTIKVDGPWPGIHYADVSRTGFEHRHHYANMIVIARAYKTKSSKFYKKKLKIKLF